MGYTCVHVSVHVHERDTQRNTSTHKAKGDDHETQIHVELQYRIATNKFSPIYLSSMILLITEAFFITFHVLHIMKLLCLPIARGRPASTLALAYCQSKVANEAVKDLVLVACAVVEAVLDS